MPTAGAGRNPLRWCGLNQIRRPSTPVRGVATCNANAGEFKRFSRRSGRLAERDRQCTLPQLDRELDRREYAPRMQVGAGRRRRPLPVAGAAPAEKNVLFVLILMLLLWVLPTFATIGFLDFWYVPPVAMVLLFALSVDAKRSAVRQSWQLGTSRKGSDGTCCSWSSAGWRWRTC